MFVAVHWQTFQLAPTLNSGGIAHKMLRNLPPALQAVIVGLSRLVSNDLVISHRTAPNENVEVNLDVSLSLSIV